MPPVHQAVTQDQRSAALRRYQSLLQKLDEETQEAFVQVEDALTAMEAREGHRAGRTNDLQEKFSAFRGRT